MKQDLCRICTKIKYNRKTNYEQNFACTYYLWTGIAASITMTMTMTIATTVAALLLNNLFKHWVLKIDRLFSVWIYKHHFSWYQFQYLSICRLEFASKNSVQNYLYNFDLLWRCRVSSMISQISTMSAAAAAMSSTTITLNNYLFNRKENSLAWANAIQIEWIR